MLFKSFPLSWPLSSLFLKPENPPELSRERARINLVNTQKHKAWSQIVSPWAPVGAKKSMIFRGFLILASGYSRGDFDTQVTYLQEQINALVASNKALTNQVYLTGDSTNTGGYSNKLIASTWSQQTLPWLSPELVSLTKENWNELQIKD